ncbi:spoIIIJ-associated protein [Ruminiclostridium sufflavum DSM 19573]|uniref:RNA-binding protein KhpB n=1 Tax=Ruminiclostridium sufflavum DSM 19573 TaxID=1121337 RepID=A0A318XPA2_9FIRM|nr:RNA-binding cell elongation regulator Jag/EloR [Ruminiclostridium sufflavum]PYG88990.1 spoIIIJ-associated protein [Ruminiclostridium sufflavum DSM 19573]
MAYSIEKTGKTVQEAISAALSELNLSEEDIDVEVIEEGTKGIFGIIGSKVARIRATVKEQESNNRCDVASDFLYTILNNMEVEADISVSEDEENVVVDINGDDIGIIIGRRGETMDALQYLTSLVVNKEYDDYKRVILNVENYRQKREETLIKLASRLAEKVVKYKKPVTLEPMNPYERRIIHSSLQGHKYVETYSTGEEPRRKVVIALKK